MAARGGRLPRPRILHGAQEPIFDVLPHRVLANLVQPASENALLWNIFYPLLGDLNLEWLLAQPPLWGSPLLKAPQDRLQPFFWGFSVEGERLPGLDQALEQVDGPGPRTEIDLILRGERALVVGEAKNLGHLGRCKRFSGGRCPPIQRAAAEEGADEQGTCRYWLPGQGNFAELLDLGPRPSPDMDAAPPCARYYQLARTLLVGQALASCLELELHLWLLIPRRRWRELEPPWLDFVRRVRDEAHWRRMRVIALESLQAPAKGPGGAPGGG